MNLIDYLTRNQLGAGYVRTPRGELLQTVRKEGIFKKKKKGGKTRRTGRRDVTVADLLHANRKCGECRRDWVPASLKRRYYCVYVIHSFFFACAYCKYDTTKATKKNRSLQVLHVTIKGTEKQKKCMVLSLNYFCCHWYAWNLSPLVLDFISVFLHILFLIYVL